MGPSLETYWELIFLWGHFGAFSGTHLGAFSEAHLGPLWGAIQGVFFRVFSGGHWWASSGGGSFRDIPGGRFGGLDWEHFRGLFEVVLYGVLHINNSLAFPISIWKWRDALGVPAYKLIYWSKMFCAEIAV